LRYRELGEQLHWRNGENALHFATEFLADWDARAKKTAECTWLERARKWPTGGQWPSGRPFGPGLIWLSAWLWLGSAEAAASSGKK